jgi:hypothetical protein
MQTRSFDQVYKISIRAATALFRYGLAAACLLAAALAASADTARTNDIRRLVDRPISQTNASSSVRAKDKAVQKPPAAETPKPDARKLGEWHKEAMELLKKKDYAKAIEKYEEIIKVTPTDAGALYNLACAYALNGDKARALERLRQSLEDGFVSFIHIARDPDLDSLRGEAAYKKLFARKEEYQRQASERAVRQITENLARQKIDAKAYKSVYDEDRRFVYLYAQSDEEFAVVRRGLEDFAECLWRGLFDHIPDQPLYIVLLTPADSPKAMPIGVGGFFNRDNNILYCAERTAAKLLQASVVLHEFTHGLHWADQFVREQDHPIWITEGLSTLFETSRRENGVLVPLPSYRMSIIQQAVKNGRSVPWNVFTKINQSQFVGNANLCYSQARCMFFYLKEKGMLKAFYDEYTKASSYEGDKSGLEAFAVVFGKPAAAVERDWKEWMLKQQIHVFPFLGVVTEEKNQRLVVKSVVRKSAAAMAGIRKGDVIAALEGTPIETRDDLMEAVGHHNVGDVIEIQLERNGDPLEVKANLVDRPEMQTRPSDRSKQTEAKDPYIGLAVGESDGDVRVREVEKDSPAEKAGIEPGWRILKLGKTDIKTIRDFLTEVNKSKPGQIVELTIRKTDGTEAVLKLETGAIPPADDGKDKDKDKNKE